MPAELNDVGQDIPMSIKMNNKSYSGLPRLIRGEPFDEAELLGLLDFIDRHYDCADFRMVSVLRVLFDFEHRLSPDLQARMRRTVLGFKYWMDEPGQDSMCYWSENHQLIFAACEYLAGQKYPEEVFTNDGNTGSYHRQKARKRLMGWFDSRLKLGFVEWHSNTYYEEDVAPLSLLIDLCEDQEIVRRATALMDLILLDMALHQHGGYFAASSGRCYELQKKYPEKQDVGDILAHAFGQPEQAADFSRLSSDFLVNRRYRLPEAIRQIANSPEPVEVKSSMGLDLSEVAQHFSDPRDIDGRGMYLWSMEAFSNPESCELSLRIFEQWKLHGNDFLKNLKQMNIPVLRQLGLLPLAIRVLNPVTQGIAIQRADTLTRRTAHYMLSTAQQYHPGAFGDQQHIWQATLKGGVSVFTTHPAAAFFEDNARNFSPSYWVGNGINPHANQHGNAVLCLYDLRQRRGMMEKARPLFTHAWFPTDRMDEHLIQGRQALGRRGDAYIALLSLHELEQGGESELIQRGKVTGWAALLGSREEQGSYGAFTAMAREASLTRTKAGLRLDAQGQRREIVYGKRFLVDGVEQDTDYPRIDSPWVRVPRNGLLYEVKAGAHALAIDGASWQRRTSEEEG